jgi:tetratricopeptide (TPR) repeat protein
MDPQPRYLLEQVIARKDFAEACSRRDMGQILALAIRYGGPGFTASHIVRQCGLTGGVSQIRDYTHRGRQANKVEVFEQIADGLRIPGSMLGMAPRPWEVTAEPPAPVESGAETGDILHMLAEADRTDIGPGTIESLQALFDRLCRDYPSAPAPDLQDRLSSFYARLIGLRQGRMTFSQHRELIALSGWATALLACVVWDQNDREAAETARATAHRFAAEIGHSELRAWTYELDAWFALTDGRYADATSIAKAAQSIAGDNHAMVQLTMQEARGWARLGNRQLTEDAMERAQRLLDKLPQVDQPRHFAFDRSKWPFYAASCYQWLGEDDKAEAAARQVLADCETSGTAVRSPMRLAEVNIILGLVSVHRGDLEAALSHGGKALDYDRKSGPSLLIRADELDQAISRAFPGSRQGAEFSERLQLLFRDFGYQPPQRLTAS